MARGSGKAQPSSVVAAELAFNRTVLSKGYQKAYETLALDGARSFDMRGEHSITALLKSADVSGLIQQAKPHQIAMSCDGSVAVSAGRYIPSGGKGGSYYRIWSLQADRSYRIELEFVTPDGKPVDAPDIIETDVANCKESDAATRLSKFAPLQAEMERDAVKFAAKVHQGMAADNSLGWFAGHATEYDRDVLVTVFRNGDWHGALGEVTEADLAPPPVPVPLKVEQ
ncbi:hypothetical protein [Altererythrobacter sp. ZODW24]|uniref:hypothetical protein n=1 Tax=Altererythrobacter sp. ZODW24 TaxID=2185142 RepID=UPI0013B41A32|nr:hypothetical protein [Altererythrobacter sp. ZODW24]